MGVRCERCPQRAHVRLAYGVLVCWACYNAIVKDTAGRLLGAKMLRKSY